MDQIEKFVKDSGLTISAFNVCFYDSNGTDEILDNILCGKKRANTGLFSLFEAQMQLLPRTLSAFFNQFSPRGVYFHWLVWYTRLSSANRNLSGQSPSILLRKTVRSLKVPTGDFIAALRFENAKLQN